MHLGPTEEDRLRIFAAAELARRVLAARAGSSFDDVVKAGHRAIRADQLMPGVAEFLGEIRVEVLLDEGSRLVVLRKPWQ